MLKQQKVPIQGGFEEEWNRGRLDVIPELFTTEVTCHTVHSPTIQGHDNWKVFTTASRNAFPDIHLTIWERRLIMVAWSRKWGQSPTAVSPSVEGGKKIALEHSFSLLPDQMFKT